ncbi:GntR family transcriptional regulator [Arthrobacter sp. ISL-72]|uniref:GntR family transcriptional regulator n=1 Tax=Arthrobacter sp. ISL-72 TaxID=2819114 RepID=UPI001BEB0197|nr:GntR family transcriptional regulator [Arthrobacter sp. ISL-72]MBT2597665.1 GntR family transcriptional regulator [Arthrobacter sp. ISL-72]
MSTEGTRNGTWLEQNDAESLSDGIYQWLRERIIDGTLTPGSRIRERELAEELQVSRIPIREALPQLESEGYIRSMPRRGAVVTQMTVRDVEELFDVRASLEVLAARLAAAECAKGAVTDGLDAALAKAEKAIAARDEVLIANVNSRIHEEILLVSNSTLLKGLMSPVEGRVRRLFHIVTDRDQVGLHREHFALCKAIAEGQVELAGALAFAHVEQSRHDSMPIVAKLLPQA